MALMAASWQAFQCALLPLLAGMRRMLVPDTKRLAIPLLGRFSTPLPHRQATRTHWSRATDPRRSLFPTSASNSG